MMSCFYIAILILLSSLPGYLGQVVDSSNCSTATTPPSTCASANSWSMGCEYTPGTGALRLFLTVDGKPTSPNACSGTVCFKDFPNNSDKPCVSPPPTCTYEGSFAHRPGGCAAYYKCVDNGDSLQQYVGSCNNGYEFSESTRKCETTATAGCSVQASSPTFSITNTTPTYETVPITDPSSTLTYTTPTPTDATTTPTDTTTTYSTTTPAEDTTTPTDATTNPTDATTTTPTDATTTPTNTTATTQTPTDTTTSSTETLVDNSLPTSTTSPTAITTTTPRTTPPRPRCIPGQRFPVANSCRKYLLCEFPGNLVTRQCSFGYRFDPNRRECRFSPFCWQ